jgi:hypothetical protein
MISDTVALPDINAPNIPTLCAQYTILFLLMLLLFIAITISIESVLFAAPAFIITIHTKRKRIVLIAAGFI